MILEQKELSEKPRPRQPGPHVAYMARRETHSSRAITSVIVAIITIALMSYLATEGILGMLGKNQLLMSWNQMIKNLVNLPDSIMLPALILIGIIIVLLGLLLLGKALLPGPLPRHIINDERSAYIIDDAVLASAVSRVVREDAGLNVSQVSTEVTRRLITTTVTPTSGIPLSARGIEKTLDPTVKGYALEPDPKVSVIITNTGVVSK